jgi:hypothetical protein
MVAPLAVRTGSSFKPATASGEPLILTEYSVPPNLAVPEGRIRFWVLMALTTSMGARPRDCSAGVSRSTEIRRLAAIGKGHGHAGDGDELRAQRLHGGIEHGLLGQRGRGQRQLHHRDAGGRILDHQRRRDARRQLAHLRLHRGHHLGDGGLDVGLGLEEHLDHRHPGQGLRLDVFDVADHGGQPALVLGGDALPISWADRPL